MAPWDQFRTTRRNGLRGSAAILAALAAGRLPVAAQDDTAAAPPMPLRPPDLTPFNDALSAMSRNRLAVLEPLILERSIAQLQAAMVDGTLTARELTVFYLYRIREFDLPNFHAVLELNPDVLEIASALDLERESGLIRGQLHGIPILLKDTISTADRLHTTAGAAALKDAFAATDAELVARLRMAGTIILGKANLSEWSYWMSSIGPSGYSALGGQVVSPYGDWIDPIGSSTGSAVGTTLNLAAASVGVETLGSILAPSGRASVVGMRPTHGAISQSGLIQLSEAFDTAGPITRSVADAAVILTAMLQNPENAGITAEDAFSPDRTGSLFDHLTANGLIGVRLGVPLYDGSLSEDENFAIYGVSAAVPFLRAAGAEVELIAPAPELPLDLYELEAAINADMHLLTDQFFQQGSGMPATMAEVVEFNDTAPKFYAPFGQDRLWQVAYPAMELDAARQWSRNAREAVRQIWSDYFASEGIAAFISIDAWHAMEIGIGGFPAITLPIGLNEYDAPVGMTLLSLPYTDSKLMGYAYAFERASRLRVPPTLPVIPA